MKCRVCGNENGNSSYVLREMMFGLREQFDYFQCAECQCLQIAQFPEDMTKYYPDNYMSFTLPLSVESSSFLRKNARKLRNSYLVFGKNSFGKIINDFIPHDKLHLLARLNLSSDSSILDVGCGNGSLLCELSEIGINQVLGVDPYIAEDIAYDNGVKVLKKDIHTVDGEWDLIMLHHVFEHLSDPLETLHSIKKHLSTDGTCLIQIPIVSKAWDVYKENWVQLDAPRHFFLHTPKSVSILAAKAGFYIEKTVYTSNDLQFWGSEQYIKDIPLRDEKSYEVNPEKSIFSSEDIDLFKKEAERLNSEERGDTAAFYLKMK